MDFKWWLLVRFTAFLYCVLQNVQLKYISKTVTDGNTRFLEIRKIELSQKT